MNIKNRLSLLKRKLKNTKKSKEVLNNPQRNRGVLEEKSQDLRRK